MEPVESLSLFYLAGLSFNPGVRPEKIRLNLSLDSEILSLTRFDELLLFLGEFEYEFLDLDGLPLAGEF